MILGQLCRVLSVHETTGVLPITSLEFLVPPQAFAKVALCVSRMGYTARPNRARYEDAFLFHHPDRSLPLKLYWSPPGVKEGSDTLMARGREQSVGKVSARAPGREDLARHLLAQLCRMGFRRPLIEFWELWRVSSCLSRPLGESCEIAVKIGDLFFGAQPPDEKQLKTIAKLAQSFARDPGFKVEHLHQFTEVHPIANLFELLMTPKHYLSRVKHLTLELQGLLKRQSLRTFIRAEGSRLKLRRALGGVKDDSTRLLKASFLLLFFQVSLRVLGYSRLQRFLLTDEPSSEGKDDQTQILETLRCVEYASHLLPISTKCLARSLTGRALLQKYEIDAKVKLGAKLEREQFQAHAWLEVADLAYDASWESWKFSRFETRDDAP